jgi:hypothetical protein
MAGPIKPIPEQTLAERVSAIAVTLDKSEITIRGWHYQGCDLWDPEQVCIWAKFKSARRRNRPRPDGIPRRIRTPAD